jgi:hypothetical protein
MNVACDSPAAVALAQTKPLVPGYLVTPFGWAAQPLVAMVQAEPGLLMHMFELDRMRMHVIALALAHLDERVPASGVAKLLFRGSIHEVLHRVVGRSPPGIRRVLRRLPFSVLSRQGYLRLIELLDDPQSAKLLHHLEETEIIDSTVRVLYEIPAVLRPVLGELIRCIERNERLDQLPEGLRWLASRGAAASFDALIADLAAHAQPGQFVARLTKLVAELPLPQTLPPVQIGKAERIDATADICTLAQRFKNCLENYVTQIDDGGCAVYLWDDQTAPAVCLVTRQGRLGWSLSEVLGPQNAQLDRKQLQRITTAFAEAGILRHSAIRSLECILQTDITMPHTRRQRRQAWEQRLWPELEEAAWIQDVIEVID